jgi:hypothetical protein
MGRDRWKQDEVTLPLRKQINDYVKEIIEGELPCISFTGYQTFRDNGSRKESEEAYFTVRKQLTAMGSYLQWAQPSDQEKIYFNKLLWSVANEFTWCLAAHLTYGEEGFLGEPDQVIDLFAAETAATLSELLVIHKNIIDPYIHTYIRKQIDNRVFNPFLTKDWWWETSRSNWCAVCAGSIGMAALFLEQDDRRTTLLDRVDRALVHYLNGFGEDGATEEGIGYWVYGFGYYIYYTAQRHEMDPDFCVPDEVKDKVRRIAEFPGFMQISGDSFVPFSDAGAGTMIPTGLLSYLLTEYSVLPPLCYEITPFNFDHCYRYAHVSRNLLWTDGSIFNSKEKDFTHYFPDRQWLVQRKESSYFALKGGSNAEEHNHNDVGSFILALSGECILTDLGAGPYTAGYFGEKRYQNVHTRSYWHNVPLIQGKEQIPTPERCDMKEVFIDGSKAEITMELSRLYDIEDLISFRRYLVSNLAKGKITLTDEFEGTAALEIEEGFISRIKPEQIEEGILFWHGTSGTLVLRYDATSLHAVIEEAEVFDHHNMQGRVYRLGLKQTAVEKKLRICLEFSFKNE